MKKTCITISLLTMALMANAQSGSRTGQSSNPAVQTILPVMAPLNFGDTLLYTDSRTWFINPTDLPGFSLQAEDLDSFALATSYASYGYTQSWDVFASTLADGSIGDFHQTYENSADTAYAFYAVSWFLPAGQADNWLEFGPVTIPAAGARISWFEKCNVAYRDGYKVLASSTGMNNYSDFTSPAIYTRLDAYPSPTAGSDTIWVRKSFNVPAGFNGLQTYFAFHHNSTDMDMLYIDEITITEGTISVSENEAPGFSVAQNYPNPANGTTVVGYNLVHSSDVLFHIYDVTGKVIYTESVNGQAAGAHRFEFNTAAMSNGLYYYTITVNGQQVSRKFAVSN